MEPKESKKLYAQEIASLSDELDKFNLAMKEVSPNGNCFFLSVANQLYGGQRGKYMHLRRELVAYMRSNINDYIPFLTEDFLISQGIVDPNAKDASNLDTSSDSDSATDSPTDSTTDSVTDSPADVIDVTGSTNAVNPLEVISDKERKQREHDFNIYLDVLSKSGSWVGDFEVQSIANMLQVSIFIHQVGNLTFVFHPKGSKSKSARNVHLARLQSVAGYEHYNSVRKKDDVSSKEAALEISEDCIASRIHDQSSTAPAPAEINMDIDNANPAGSGEDMQTDMQTGSSSVGVVADALLQIGGSTNIREGKGVHFECNVKDHDSTPGRYANSVKAMQAGEKDGKNASRRRRRLSIDQTNHDNRSQRPVSYINILHFLEDKQIIDDSKISDASFIDELKTFMLDQDFWKHKKKALLQFFESGATNHDVFGLFLGTAALPKASISRTLPEFGRFDYEFVAGKYTGTVSPAYDLISGGASSTSIHKRWCYKEPGLATSYPVLIKCAVNNIVAHASTFGIHQWNRKVKPYRPGYWGYLRTVVKNDDVEPPLLDDGVTALSGNEVPDVLEFMQYCMGRASANSGHDEGSQVDHSLHFRTFGTYQVDNYIGVIFNEYGNSDFEGRDAERGFEVLCRDYLKTLEHEVNESRPSQTEAKKKKLQKAKESLAAMKALPYNDKIKKVIASVLRRKFGLEDDIIDKFIHQDHMLQLQHNCSPHPFIPHQENPAYANPEMDTSKMQSNEYVVFVMFHGGQGTEIYEDHERHALTEQEACAYMHAPDISVLSDEQRQFLFQYIRFFQPRKVLEQRLREARIEGRVNGSPLIGDLWVIRGCDIHRPPVPSFGVSRLIWTFPIRIPPFMEAPLVDHAHILHEFNELPSIGFKIPQYLVDIRFMEWEQREPLSLYKKDDDYDAMVSRLKTLKMLYHDDEQAEAEVD